MNFRTFSNQKKKICKMKIKNLLKKIIQIYKINFMKKYQELTLNINNIKKYLKFLTDQ